MKSVTIETGKALVATNTITHAIIECFDGRHWASCGAGTTSSF